MHLLRPGPGQETASLTQGTRRQCDLAEAACATTKTFMKTKTTNALKRAKASSPALHIRSIMVPLDFSPPSRKALEAAVAFARRFKAKLTLVHVVEPMATPDFASTFPLVMESDQVKAAAKGKLTSLIKEARIPRGTVGQVLVRFGSAFHEITDAARMLKVDLIIISTHGHTGLKHALLGSTAERVVRHAPCPVFVVRGK